MLRSKVPIWYMEMSICSPYCILQIILASNDLKKCKSQYLLKKVFHVCRRSAYVTLVTH